MNHSTKANIAGNEQIVSHPTVTPSDAQCLLHDGLGCAFLRGAWGMYCACLNRLCLVFMGSLLNK